jgi:uncharacterized SAM-binding protein YcdF (DUF218 family)
VLRGRRQPSTNSPVRDYFLVALILAIVVNLSAAASGAMSGPLVLLVAPLVGGLVGVVGVVRRLILGTAALLGVMLVLLLATPILRPAVDYLEISQQPIQADAIVVLGGGYNCSTSTLSSTSLSRLLKGLELWRAGYAPTITLSQTPRDLFATTCGSIAPTADALVSRLLGTERPSVEYLKDVRTTRTEALEVSRLARERGWTRLLLVTGLTHTRRATATFQKAGLTVTTVAADPTTFDPALPWPSDRWVALSTITREYLGLIKYRLNGWL